MFCKVHHPQYLSCLQHLPEISALGFFCLRLPWGAAILSNILRSCHKWKKQVLSQCLTSKLILLYQLLSNLPSPPARLQTPWNQESVLFSSAYPPSHGLESIFQCRASCCGMHFYTLLRTLLAITLRQVLLSLLLELNYRDWDKEGLSDQLISSICQGPDLKKNRKQWAPAMCWARAQAWWELRSNHSPWQRDTPHLGT